MQPLIFPYLPLFAHQAHISCTLGQALRHHHHWYPRDQNCSDMSMEILLTIEYLSAYRTNAVNITGFGWCSLPAVLMHTR